MLCAALNVVGENFHCPKCEKEFRVPPPQSAPSVMRVFPPAPRIAMAPLAAARPKAQAAAAPRPPVTVANAGTFKGALFGRKGWCLVDCLSGAWVMIDTFPFEIGSADAVDLKIEDLLADHCTLKETRDQGLCLVKSSAQAGVTVNGGEAGEVTSLAPNSDYTLKLGARCFALRGGRSMEAWHRHLDPALWCVLEGNTPGAPVRADELQGYVVQRVRNPENVLVAPKGLAPGAGFLFGHFCEALEHLRAVQQAAATDEVATASVSMAAPGGPQLICPVCWLPFEKGDVMHIAQHETLRGDPQLGVDAALRFHANRFDDNGHALDALGLPCPDLACPHCRRKLPPGFLDVPHHIFSIVGAPSAGKSYYMSVLARMLPRALYTHFNIVFRDADPTGNAKLNVMKNRLFTGATPEQVYLDKTNLEGEMYEEMIRQGRRVKLPRPFIFSLGVEHDQSRSCALVLYDNAGEHFEPGIDEANSPGAQHIAAASGVFFLFDPTVNLEFRRKLAGHKDPQLFESKGMDQQDTILAEMEVRIKRLLHLDRRSKIHTPLAMLIGKYDVWMDLLPKDALVYPIHDGLLDMDMVKANSQCVRNLMLEICPEMVANAEILSDDVMYFPVSAFGHTPLKLPDGRIAPDPLQLRPQYVEVPVIWALAQTIPGLIPAHVK